MTVKICKKNVSSWNNTHMFINTVTLLNSKICENFDYKDKNIYESEAKQNTLWQDNKRAKLSQKSLS